MTDLERFVKRLLETLKARHPAGAQRPFTVAELRGAVLPYRMHRSALGLSSSEDYELLVFRLMAEEGGFARTTPPDAADRAREELASPVPDLDLVELWGDATLQLTHDVASRLAAIESAELAEVPSSAEPVAPVAVVDPLLREADSVEAIVDGAEQVHGLANDEKPVAVDLEESVISDAEQAEGKDSNGLDVEPLEGKGSNEPDAELLIEELLPTAPVAAPDTSVSSDVHAREEISAELSAPAPFEPLADSISVDGITATSTGERVCLSCEAPLPSDRLLAFCPFCGEQVGVRRCRRCGSEMEPDWRYCGACGEAHVR